MELLALRVQQYRCLTDTGWVDTDGLTCIIGKNESGKTAFMRAVEQLNPAVETEGFEPYEDYPRQNWSSFDPETDEQVVASGRFKLSDDDVETLTETYENDILEERTVVVHRDYQNERTWEIELKDSVVPDLVVDCFDLPDGLESRVSDCESARELDGSKETKSPLQQDLSDELGAEPQQALTNHIGETVLAASLPTFRFINEYAIMDGTIAIEEIIERVEDGALSPGDQAFLSLLAVADLDPEDLSERENWRETQTALESASARVSDEAMSYWSQTGNLQIRLQENITDEDHRVLDLRVENKKHNVSVEFAQRSRGFRWFFSTFCQLAELREADESLVLLLDEPGLNLHPRAKQQFLSFLGDDIGSHHTVIYTTHSPFMIDPATVHRTQMVMAEPIGETNLTSDVTLADNQTKFPLRNVFELDLMDTLLVNPQVLLVEQKADHIILNVVSRMLKNEGTDGLDDRWTVVPVVDQQNIRQFVSLFGKDRLDVVALLRAGDAGEPDEMGIVNKSIAQFTDHRDGQLEDVLSEPFYIELVNRTYAGAIEAADSVGDRIEPAAIGDTGPVVDRLSQYFADTDINTGTFDREEVARYLQENRDTLSEELDKETVRQFGRLCRDLTTTLESFDRTTSRESGLFSSLFG